MAEAVRGWRKEAVLTLRARTLLRRVLRRAVSCLVGCWRRRSRSQRTAHALSAGRLAACRAGSFAGWRRRAIKSHRLARRLAIGVCVFVRVLVCVRMDRCVCVCVCVCTHVRMYACTHMQVLSGVATRPPAPLTLVIYIGLLQAVRHAQGGAFSKWRLFVGGARQQHAAMAVRAASHAKVLASGALLSWASHTETKQRALQVCQHRNFD